MGRLKVVLLEPEIQAPVFADGRHTEGCQSGDAIVSVVVMNNGRLSRRPPCPSTGGNEKKAAFIEENRMGPKSLRLFLYAATCSASDAQWPVGPVGWLGARALDMTSPHVAIAARGGWGDTRHRTPYG